MRRCAARSPRTGNPNSTLVPASSTCRQATVNEGCEVGLVGTTSVVSPLPCDHVPVAAGSAEGGEALAPPDRCAGPPATATSRLGSGQETDHPRSVLTCQGCPRPEARPQRGRRVAARRDMSEGGRRTALPQRGNYWPLTTPRVRSREDDDDLIEVVDQNIGELTDVQRDLVETVSTRPGPKAAVLVHRC